MNKFNLIAILFVSSTTAITGYGLHEQQYNKSLHTAEQPANYSTQIIKNFPWKAAETNRTADSSPRPVSHATIRPDLISAGPLYRPDGPSIGGYAAVLFSRKGERNLIFRFGMEAEAAVRKYSVSYWLYSTYYRGVRYEAAWALRGIGELAFKVTSAVEITGRAACGVAKDPLYGTVEPQLDISAGARWWFSRSWAAELLPGIQFDNFSRSFFILKAGITLKL